ncbi:MAG: GMC family oxidoreductase N-terminal domain-containing protein [Ilumatobacteraceae bacterium]|nr:GMC family oxidoreductase N-terminal domain-containing protein [Ilumatobacteraceae bacterium]
MTMQLPIVVIGGGTAGCTVVSTLAAMTTQPIVLIEPGSPSLHDDESAFFSVLADAALSREVQITLVDGGSDQPYVQAQVLGGGSAINGLLLTGEEPSFLSGLTRVASEADCGQVGTALLAENGRFSRLWWNGGRWNPGRAVQHLVDEGRVTIISDSVTYLEHAQRVVTVAHTTNEAIEGSLFVMCAGALATPALLLHSSLERAVTGIGDGLQNHPTITFTLQLKQSVSQRFDATVVRESRSSSGAELLTIAYERTNADDAITGLLSISLMDPESRGGVWRSQTAMQHDFNMLATIRDRVAMREAVRELISTAMSASFSAISHRVLVDSDGTSVEVLDAMKNAEFDEWIAEHLTVVSHATSSCHEIVDSDGKVRGVGNLYIADSSILHSVPPCSPAGPVVIQAARIARAIGETLT